MRKKIKDICVYSYLTTLKVAPFFVSFSAALLSYQFAELFAQKKKKNKRKMSWRGENKRGAHTHPCYSVARLARKL